MKIKYPIGGFAPGNYSNKCVSCKEEFVGDKLARQCEPCAINTVNESNTKALAELHKLKQLEMKEFIDYLERKIEGCDNLGGMEREKAIYQSVLKEYRKQLTISDVSGQSEQLPNTCECDNVETYNGRGNEPCVRCLDCGRVW